jgi:DNA-binding IclR family transcriptional regulator
MDKSTRHATDPGSLERALQLARLLASAGGRGAGLTELSRLTGLPHPTVHRLLQRLLDERLARQMPSTRRYALGPLAFELGLAAAQQFDIRAACRPGLERIARELGDTAYLVVRSGLEAVCIDRQEGPSPIRVFTLEIGSRRPLGLGAAGLAILAALPKEERAEVLAQVSEQVLKTGQLPAAEFRSSIERCCKEGHSFIRNRVTLGVSAVGVAIHNALGAPVGAVSVAAIDARLTPKRVAILAAALHREARAMERSLKDGGGFAYD